MKRSRRELSGIMMMLQASVAFSLMALCVKLACRNLPSQEVVFFRSFIGFLFTLLLVRRKRASYLGRRKSALVLRGISGFLALILYFYTIKHLPLGTAVIINYAAPIFAALLAIFFLKEPLSISLLGMILIGFYGVYLVVGAKFAEWNLGVWTGIFSAVFAAIAYVAIRAIRHRESPLTVVLYFTGVSVIGSLFLLPINFKWPDLTSWLILFVLGIAASYGQLWLTIALRRARTSLITPFSYVTPLLSFVYGLFLLHEKPVGRSYAGCLLIIISGVLVSVFETKIKKPNRCVNEEAA